MVLAVAESPKTHWRYSIIAVRLLRTLIRRDKAMGDAHLRYLFKTTHDSHASMVRCPARRATIHVLKRIASATSAHFPLACRHNLTLFQYAQRAIMKSSRFIKLRTMAHDDTDMVLEQNHNPLRHRVPVTDPSHAFTKKLLHDFKVSPDGAVTRRP
jgi:proteasome activator subunit 4